MAVTTVYTIGVREIIHKSVLVTLPLKRAHAFNFLFNLSLRKDAYKSIQG